MVLIPLASATFLQERAPAGPNASAFRKWVDRVDAAWKAVMGWAYDKTIEPLARGYEKLLRIVLRRRMDVVMASLLAMGSMVVPAMNVSCDSGKNFGSRNITVRYSMPSDTTLDEANAFFKEVEGIIDGVADEYHVEGAAVGFDESNGRVWIFFKPPEEGERPFEEFAKELAEMLPTRPGWHKTSQFGDSDGARDDTFQLAIFGDDHERVQEAREELEQRVLELDGVVGIRKGDEDSRRRQELSLSVERDMAERYGVPGSVVANTVAYAIRGSPLPRYHTDEREVEVRVRYREDDRRDVEQLLGYRVPSQSGETVPIRTLAEKELTNGETVLQRTNKRVGAVIRLELDDANRVESIKELVAFLQQYQLPEGLSFDADIERQSVSDMQRDLGGALLLGSIFIFLLMGFLFESVVLPLSVLPAIPLSFVGVWWFLYATGETIDPLAGIGIVLLLGVVVNNAIVLIDFVNQARASGLSRDAAIIAAGRLRFRPILMTALTTIGGMLPLAFSQHTGEGIPYGPFGKALVGGMTTATILTLIVVPVTYTYLDDLRSATGQWVRRILATLRR
jgi:HAE1 family hydrophobic/amphiphilic exporter-1